MQTCGNCLFCQPHPAIPQGVPAGQCFGVPPKTLLLPVQQQPQGRVLKPNEAPAMRMELTSIRPTVQHADAACSVFQAKLKH